MIEATGLSRTFGGLVAVDDVTLSIPEGEAFAFLGPNGAGKTTTVRMLCCLIEPTGGTGRIAGLDIRQPKERVKIRGMIGLLPENPGLYESLGAYRNVDFYARLYDVPDSQRRSRIETLLKKLGIWERRDEPVGKFSKGMKQKVAIARALVHNPKYLFLDEPTAALDPESAKTVREFLIELKKEGVTLFLNTHNLDEAQRVADRIGVLKTKLLAVGRPDELASRFYGRTTKIELASMADRFPAAVRELPYVLQVRIEGSSLLIDLDDPKLRNPEVVSVLMRQGAQVEFVEEVRHGLEDIYLRLVGGGR
ncbi:MAG TPA: ABC transporter ATP-binding protein [Methanomassiliicoccales archaeon]|nr:ABC transporter ATP-binding protein [Methanomassiliicoccales archaeon]